MYATSIIKEFLIHTGKTIFRNKTDQFIDDFKRDILDIKIRRTALSAVLNYYSLLRSNRNLISLKSPGAGSKNRSSKTIVSQYARRTSVSKKRGKLLYRVVLKFKPELIIELGTSLGISAMYMLAANPLARLITVEGNPQIADMAASNFRLYRYDNVTVINRLFDDIVSDLVREVNANTLVFIDGNHGFDATLRYFHAFSEASVVVLDDIRWSEDMMRAWKQIKSSVSNATTIDLYDMGIIINGGPGKEYSFWL
ncbi:MAG TPA: class I SAM-dependent methyltransferase [Bacteroidales bacterium]|jgi:predicted O-methyltransferase YrrM|nr:class I SAM-dependent methyltransferase [Bacteroidales bacterium]